MFINNIDSPWIWLYRREGGFQGKNQPKILMEGFNSQDGEDHPAVVISRFSRVLFFVTLWIVASRLLCPWDSPGKNTGVGYHFIILQ